MSGVAWEGGWPFEDLATGIGNGFPAHKHTCTLSIQQRNTHQCASQQQQALRTRLGRQMISMFIEGLSPSESYLQAGCYLRC